MRKRILSLILALSMLMPVIGAFSITVSAENADIGLYSNSENILTLDAYDEKLSELGAGKSDEQLAMDDGYRTVLFQRRLVEKAGGYEKLAA